jgi:nucleoside 2-deoxyribosyltransferase
MKCTFCENDNIEFQLLEEDLIHKNCANCGSYIISSSMDFLLEKAFDVSGELYRKKHLVSGYINEQNEKGNKYYRVKIKEIRNIMTSGIIPITIWEKIEKIISRLYKRTNYIYEDIEIDHENLAYFYASNSDEFQNMVTVLQELDFIKIPYIGTPITLELTMKGIEYAEKTRIATTRNNQCFVAMWFSDEMIEVFDRTIKQTIEECGYTALIISMKEHNDLINDQIIAEIRKSKFIIADFSGNRGGVYFESGFAMGLGKQVIWTCKKEYFNSKITRKVQGNIVDTGEIREMEIIEESKMHFDIDHYNFIVWENEEELGRKLKSRIEATII